MAGKEEERQKAKGGGRAAEGSRDGREARTPDGRKISNRLVEEGKNRRLGEEEESQEDRKGSVTGG